MTSKIRPIAITAFLLCLLSSPLLADIVHLANGGRIEGTVTDKGDSIVVTHRFGAVTVKKSDIVRIEEKAALTELYAERRAALDPSNPDALVELGKWCREHGWEAQAVKEFKAALELDADHRGAHLALDHVLYEGVWRTEHEIMELRGYVLVDGKWLTRREAARVAELREIEKAEKARRDELKALQRRLTRAFRAIANGTEKQAVAAVKDVETLAGEIGDENLGKIARDAKAWYDQAWKEVRRQSVIAETRATWSELKRPIPTLTTSLGAGSTPVTLQLPELKIARVSTTVVIPAGRGK
jgi:hypothetical protein